MTIYRRCTLLITVSNQLIRVVKLLLPQPNSETGGHGFMIQVNAKNKKGETALDLYHQIPDRAPEIGHLLHEAGGREGYLLEQKQSFPNLRSAKNDLLVVLAIFIGLAISITCSLPTLFPKENFVASQVVFQYKHVVSQDLPLVFYIMSLLTVVFTISTGFLVVLLCSFPCGCLLLLAAVATFIVYALFTYYIVPKFFIRIGSHYVSSFYLMWILAVAFIFLGAQSILVWKCLSMQSYDFAKWLKMKLVSNVVFPSKKSLRILSDHLGYRWLG
ncbi:hypothetical protein ACOSQ3_027513 [Xanthoceras sorbifolium]